MTEEIATIVASMLRSSDLFQVDDGEVWIPDLDNYAFLMRDHIAKALELHGFTARTSSRSHSGLRIKVPEAESVESWDIRDCHTAGYGYTGRVSGLAAEGQNFEVSMSEPGNVLEIPELGWAWGDERVVIGDYCGLHLAKVDSEEVETYSDEDKFRVESRIYENEQEMSLFELAEKSRVIIFKGEWNGYPEERF